MKHVIGSAIIILGIAIMVLGGLGITAYYVYDLIVNWDELSRSDIAFAIIFIIFRDILAIVVGGVMAVIGGLVASGK